MKDTVERMNTDKAVHFKYMQFFKFVSCNTIKLEGGKSLNNLHTRR